MSPLAPALAALALLAPLARAEEPATAAGPSLAFCATVEGEEKYKDAIMRYFNQGLSNQARRIASLSESAGCDVVFSVAARGGGWARALAYSGHSKRLLDQKELRAFMGAESKLGRAMSAAFAPGTALHQAAVSERDRSLAPVAAAPPAPPAPAPPPAAAVSKAELQEMIASAVAAKAAPQASPPPPTYSSDVDQPKYQLKEDAASFAVVIGVEKYIDLPAAQFAERDAAAVRAHLRALGYPERNIVLLTGERAGKAGFEKILETWLPANVTPDSEVFVYFSGHGAADVKTGQPYLLPRDGDPQFLENTAYPVKRLSQKLSALKAKRIWVALDSCFSGAGGRSVLAPGTRPLVTKVDMPMAPGKVAWLSASGPDQISGSLEEQGHGLFTYYFLRGLNGEAKTPAGGMTLKSLYSYLRPKVQDEARRQNRDQTPMLVGDIDWSQ